MSGALAASIITGVLGVVAVVVSGRMGRDTADRPVALAELQAALAEQRVMLDRARAERTEDRRRIDALEAEVEACERGRAADRRRHEHEQGQLRADVRRLAEIVRGS